MLNHSGF